MAESDTPTTTGTAAAGLLAELTAIDDDVDAGARDMAQLIAQDTLPDGALLSAARLRFSRALRRHLQHVDGAVMPYLRSAEDRQGSDSVDGFRRLLNTYHEAAAHHVAQWPSNRVAADWNGYRRAVAAMLARLRERRAVERRDIHPLLARRDPLR